MKRLAALVLVALVATVLVGVGSAAAAQASEESDFVARTNAARAARGVGGLTVNAELTGVARRWSAKMASANSLSHNPNLAREVTANWEKLAENVGFGSTVEDIHQAFMNSAAHRNNILDGALTHIGVGVVIDGEGGIWVTEVFMRLRAGGGGGTVATSSPPTAAPPPTTTRPRPVVTSPRVTALPTTEAPTTTVAPTTTQPPPPREPTPRLVLVLDQLRDLDGSR